MRKKLVTLAALAVLAGAVMTTPAEALPKSFECSILAGAVYGICKASGDPPLSCGQVAVYVYDECMMS